MYSWTWEGNYKIIDQLVRERVTANNDNNSQVISSCNLCVWLKLERAFSNVSRSQTLLQCESLATRDYVLNVLVSSAKVFISTAKRVRL